MSILPVNLDDLVHGRSVESMRIEYKKTWSQPIAGSLVRSICAFANDFFNINGGYIILGIDEEDGKPILPPHGLENFDLDEIQKTIRGNCKRIAPEYQPILAPEIFQDKQILVVWAPGGPIRPYQAPRSLDEGKRNYYVRQGSETVEARDTTLTQLMQMATTVPFDDRRNLSATLHSISPALVKNYLTDVKSDLIAPEASISDYDLYHSLRLTARVNGHEVPRNVALLFFADDPEAFFPGARIEIVQFGDDAGGDLIEEQIFRGPLHFQLRRSLEYLNGLSTTMVRKVPNQAEAQRTVAYPYEAMEEALVNAVYHRSYDGTYEPTKAYLYPDRLEITSYPGPVQGINLEHFASETRIPAVPYRNRRIGDFLKDLKLAEARGTGIPKIRRKMMDNGSPQPVFQFGDDRSYFQVTLPAHPQYIVLHALRESAHLWIIGDRQRAVSNLNSSLNSVPTSGALIAQLIDYRASLGELRAAETLFNEIKDSTTITDLHLPYRSMAQILLNRGETQKANDILEQAPLPTNVEEIMDIGLLYKRAERYGEAHRIFADNFDYIKNEPRYLQEYSQIKICLATAVDDMLIKTRLNNEAVGLLRRAIQLSSGDAVKSGWGWYELATTLDKVEAPESEVHQAYTNAINALPTEMRFQEMFQVWKAEKNQQ